MHIVSGSHTGTCPPGYLSVGRTLQLQTPTKERSLKQSNRKEMVGSSSGYCMHAHGGMTVYPRRQLRTIRQMTERIKAQPATVEAYFILIAEPLLLDQIARLRDDGAFRRNVVRNLVRPSAGRYPSDGTMLLEVRYCQTFSA